MVKTKLNIPAILVREVNGKEMLMSGTLVSINESLNTCKMEFNGKVYKNIPMNQVLINEGFLDKVKEYSQKAYNFIKKTVKGFVTLVNEATGKIVNWSSLNVHNIAVLAVNNQLPNGILFAPSQTLRTEVGGMSIDEAFAPAMANDRREIEKYWRRVINRAGTTADETIEESVQYVNERFYNTSGMYKALNEGAIYTLDDIKTEEGYGGYGTKVNAKQLKSRLIANIRNQLAGTPGKHADEPAILIWGAPGIGKTAIVNSTIKEMANRKVGAMNLSLITIMLAGYTIENWTLPSLLPGDVNQFSDCPKAWLPVYLNTDDPAERARRDHYCNTGEYRNAQYSADGRMFEGGIVFMDEYSRTAPNVQNIIMGLINEHKFGDDYRVASKWGFVFAANRSYDDAISDTDDRRYYPVAAQNNRFVQYTYVPDKEGWLDWATSIDPITHKANVPPFITEFIASADEHVWYSTIVNGGYDDMLGKMVSGNAQEIDSMKNGKHDQFETVMDFDTLKVTKRLVTPRTWANFIGPNYEKQLIILLGGNSQGLTGEEMYQKLIDQSIIKKTDAEGNSYKEYYGGILPNLLVNALNDIDADYWDEEYEIMGGDEELDPTHTLNGKYGRFNKFMAWVRIKMAELTGDGEKKSPLIRDWDEYNSYAKYITDDVIASIWETGHMPDRYVEDDDFMSPNGIAGYATTTYSKWKSKSLYQTDIINNKILPSYPGDIYQDMADDYEAFTSAKISKQDAEDILNKAAADCTFTLLQNGKPVKKSYFFNIGKDLKDPKSAFAYAKIIQTSKVCQNFMHVITWAAKVSMQTKSNRIYKDIDSHIIDILNNCPDKKIKDNFMNSDAVNAARRSKDKAAESVALANSLIAPVLHMLNQCNALKLNDAKEK